MIVYNSTAGFKRTQAQGSVAWQIGGHQARVRGSYSERERYSAVSHFLVRVLEERDRITILNRLRINSFRFFLKEMERYGSGDAT